MASSSSLVPLSRSPSLKSAMPRLFLFQLCRSAFALPEPPKGSSQIALGLGPVEWHSLAGPFLQGIAIGSNCLFQLPRPTLMLSETGKSIAQIALGLGPVEWHALAGPLL